jgi:hypothetical protein
MAGDPQTFQEVFDFYSRYVKILYCDVQATNVLPVEVLFELNAAFDHASRHWVYGESEADVVKKIYSHLKRSCLDIFKVRAKQTLDHYDELKKLDTSLLDNGHFETNMRRLIHEIREGTREARRHEGFTSNDAEGSVEAFGRWQPVYDLCSQFDAKFYRHSHLDWARKKARKLTFKKFLVGLILAAIAGAVLNDPLTNFLKWGVHQVCVRAHLEKWDPTGVTPAPTLTPPPVPTATGSPIVTIP